MPTPYTPLAVANYFLESFANGEGIEHMKLQKLVYLAHGWWLTRHPAEPLVTERPKVWRYGPAFASLYQVLQVFGRAPIFKPQSVGPFEEPDMVDRGDETVIQLLDWIWSRYGHLSSFDLSDLTHRDGTSWRRIAREHGYSVPAGLEIPDHYIAQEFESALNFSNADFMNINSVVANDRRDPVLHSA